jgi:hypothetical protein
MEIRALEASALFSEAIWNMRISGVEEDSRNGLVKTIPEPVILKTLDPTHRVIFVDGRKENPYFHFAECLWMMAGSNDAYWLSTINPRITDFAEADGRMHGAYGHRWREHFGVDQILETIRLLKTDPNTRRAVIAMWDPSADLNMRKKDIPCNTHIYFRRADDRLNMSVLNRSNDLVWGALGSNIVHFSFLQELIAHAVDLKVGSMYQITNNLHIYERHWHFLEVPPHFHTYAEMGILPYKIIKGDIEGWLRECEEFVHGDKRDGFNEPFFNEVAVPLMNSQPHLCKAEDWRLACERYDKRKVHDR